MTRQLEQGREERQKKRDLALIVALEYGLVQDIGRAGGVLLGFSVKISPEDVLMTVKVELAGKRQIAFVGAATLPDVVLKACRDGRRDKLRWRADKYGG